MMKNVKTGRKFWATLLVFGTATALLLEGDIAPNTWMSVTKYVLLFFAPANILEHLIHAWGAPWKNKAQGGA
jgi:hypothetical protein